MSSHTTVDSIAELPAGPFKRQLEQDLDTVIGWATEALELAEDPTTCSIPMLVEEAIGSAMIHIDADTDFAEQIHQFTPSERTRTELPLEDADYQRYDHPTQHRFDLLDEGYRALLAKLARTELDTDAVPSVER